MAETGQQKLTARRKSQDDVSREHLIVQIPQEREQKRPIYHHSNSSAFPPLEPHPSFPILLSV